MHEKELKKYFSRPPKLLERLFVRCNYLWEIIPEIGNFLKNNISRKMEGLKVGEVYIDNDVQIGQGTVIEHGAMLKGPAVIGKNCQIRNGAYFRGNVFVGDNCVIGHCTEVKNSIIMEGAHLGHFNYVGDSLVGKKVNLGAGSILSNLRFDKSNIQIDGKNTGLNKIGAILGDNCQLGCHTVLNPGTIFQKNILYAGKPLKNGIYDKEIIKEIIQKKRDK